MAERWGLLRDDNTIHEITEVDPSGRFPQEMKWIVVKEETVENAGFDIATGAITNPPKQEPQPLPVVPPPPPNTRLSRLEFFELFSIDEEAALEGSTDKIIAVGLRRLNAADYVDLASETVKAFVGYLGQSKALPASRVADVLAGHPAPAFSAASAATSA